MDYATPIVGCRAHAEDIVQDAYLRFDAAAPAAGSDEEAIGRPVGYLYRTVRNLALNWLRGQKGETSTEEGAMLERMAAATPSPEQQASDREKLALVAAALAELPDRTRQAFEMHRLGGQTLTQIAATLGISVGLAHQLVREALTHCAHRLNHGS